MQIVDLCCGCGGFSLGARRAGATVVLAIDADERIAKAYRANHGDHVRVETLGGDCAALAAELTRIDALHLHFSPPCQQFSSANWKRKADVSLIEFCLNLVERVQPKTWSMEECNHPMVRQLLSTRGLAHTVVNCVNFGVPQSRVRLIAGTPAIVDACRTRAGTGATVLPRDVLDLDPTRFALRSPTTNQPIKRRVNGVRITEGHRRMEDSEGVRKLDEPAHTVTSKAARVFDKTLGGCARRLSVREAAALQGFPADYVFDTSIARSRLMIGNACPVSLSEFITRQAMTLHDE